MANTNMLIVGSVFVIGGILTIPFVVGLFMCPFWVLSNVLGHHYVKSYDTTCCC